MPLINTGKYRHVVIIKAPSSTRDTAGGRVGAGATVATVWAAKQDWAGSEVRDDGKDTAVVTTKFFIRYRNDVLPAMQLIDGEVTYDIESILDFDGMKRELTLNCRRVV